MYTIPARDDIEEVVITPGVIEKQDQPVLVLKKDSGKKAARKDSSKNSGSGEKKEKLA